MSRATSAFSMYANETNSVMPGDGRSAGVGGVCVVFGGPETTVLMSGGAVFCTLFWTCLLWLLLGADA